MPLDSIAVHALKIELTEALTGAKIDKVQQPAKDILILGIHGGGVSRRLLISAGTGSSRIHFTGQTFENPQSPPMFCMLLRKHLVGSRISAVSQPDFDRVLTLDLDSFDDMGVPAKKQLVVEMMGRNSNVILLGPEGHIIDCLRRVDGDMSRSRQVLPGLIYHRPPPQDKPAFVDCTAEEISAIYSPENGLLDSFSGLSPLICREIAFSKNPLEELISLKKRIETENFTPTMIYVNEKQQDFSFMPIVQYESAGECKSFTDFSELLDTFYAGRDKTEQMRRKSLSLMKSVKSAHERAVRKLAARRQELLKTGEREINRKRGDLITANLYKLKKGDGALVTEDYYEDGAPEIKISLDPLKTPQQNAAAYYRQYNKAKTAEKYLGGLIEQGEKEESYLASVLDVISRAEGDIELAEIRRELTGTGFIRKQKTAKREKIKETAPLKFTSSSGMEILVGRNNTQNDKLTTKTARRSDIWLHVQKIHGSHVIISCEDSAPDDITIQEAASLAVYFSQARDGGKTAVDYTQVKNVKKPSGAMPGAVIFTDYKTIIVEAALPTSTSL